MPAKAMPADPARPRDRLAKALSWRRGTGSPFTAARSRKLRLPTLAKAPRLTTGPMRWAPM